MAAYQVPIHHVVVHQREGVHELDADRGGQGILSGTADVMDRDLVRRHRPAAWTASAPRTRSPRLTR